MAKITKARGPTISAVRTRRLSAVASVVVEDEALTVTGLETPAVSVESAPVAKKTAKKTTKKR